MSMDAQNTGQGASSGRSIMPPYLLLRDFLDEATVAGLLDYAHAHQSEFGPTKVGGANVNPSVRKSESVRQIGHYRRVLKTRIFDLLPTIVAKLGMALPETLRFETELVAHGDGAFYKRHIDTRTASDLNHLRVLSGVYYFHSLPKAFSGGALRFYAIGGTDENHVDIEPTRNSLLVFPSWAPHEVMPVSCPSQRFSDSRFAINCWVHRANAVDAA